MYMVRDLNRWAGDKVMEDITVAFGVSSENKNSGKHI